ncbi:MAG: helix-turn-helix transcriptional regulator, partial [Anaerolineae bacterium]|nr:helix-turn-helix transcriptional regulator [Anaerolineae bacterium]
ILFVLSKGPNHGYQIAKAIKQQSEGILDFKEGTLYPALHGLEEQGMIEAIEREENGRLRRYYRLTQDGHALLEQALDEWTRYSSAVNTVLKGAQSS